LFVHGKNGFAKILAGYRKVILLNYKKLLAKLVAKISKFFAALLIIFKVPTKLFGWSSKIIFRSVSSKILDPSAKSFFPCMTYRIKRSVLLA